VSECISAVVLNKPDIGRSIGQKQWCRANAVAHLKTSPSREIASSMQISQILAFSEDIPVYSLATLPTVFPISS